MFEHHTCACEFYMRNYIFLTKEKKERSGIDLNPSKEN